jgi:hypothetical protein
MSGSAHAASGGAARAGAWRRWVALTSRRECGAALAAFRVAVGAVLFFSVLSMATSGMASVLWVDVARGGMRQLGSGNWLLAALGGPVPGAIGSLLALALVSGVLVTLGLGGRAPILVALQSYQALCSADPAVIGGYDRMITNALWLLFLGRSTATLSLDCRLRSGAWRSDDEIPAWPRYLVIFQQVVVYTTTGLHYSALYWVFQEPTWRRFDMSWTAWAYPLTQIATAVTWHWELSAPLLLLFYHFRATPEMPGRLRAFCNRHDLRIPFAAIGVALHLGILLTLNVGPFSWISLAYYLCLWRPEELERFLRFAMSRRGATLARTGDGPGPALSARERASAS